MRKPTEEQIAEWKKQHGQIFEVTVEDKSCILRKPTRKELGRASQISSKSGNSIKFNEQILAVCWLHGDEEIKTNDEYFFGASQQIDEIITFKESSLKKL